MSVCRPLVLIACVIASLGATYPTTNFVVEAPTPAIAQQIGQLAEHYRKEKAIQWLGNEMPPWPNRCPIQVKVTMSGAGGATSFTFDRGRVLGQTMVIEGSLDRLLVSVLPHEITHTVFAHHFRCPLPRWADEGGAVLSEDEAERNRHDQICREILNTPGRAIRMRTLFSLMEYPRNDVMALYAQGFSIANFLVASSSRPAFLNFVAHGMQHGWDNAIQVHYRYQNVEDLEQAWLTHLRNTRRQPTQLAKNAEGEPGQQRVLVRQTAPPVQPLDPAPTVIFRGVAPCPEQEGQRFGQPASTRPGYLPDYRSPQVQGPPATLAPPLPSGGLPPDGWQPIPPPGNKPPPAVHLGQPQFGPPIPR